MKKFASLVLIGCFAASSICAQGSNNLSVAKRAAKWIKTSEIKNGTTLVWPSDPLDKASVSTDLYSGSSGVVIFLLELYRSTGDGQYLKQALAGTNYLIAKFDQNKENGLYEGIAGIGFAVIATYKISGKEKYRTAAVRIIDLLKSRAIEKGKGVQWGETTDIVAGTAGTGLFLLYAAKELNDPSLVQLAAKAGMRLIEVARHVDATGLKWAMDDKYPVLMPNFAHGTAGISYFLATLYQQTNDPVFLKAAIDGANYLTSVADTENDSCKIFHSEPNGKKLYYLSWCHGPAGTARLFYRLYQITGEKEWVNWVEMSAKAIMSSGIPERQTPGFWNNVSQCCGSAGVGEFTLSIYRVTGEKKYLEFTKRVTDNLLSRSSKDGDGLKWIQAEHRVKPDLLVAQTGLMQGAAGVGLFMLHLNAAEKNKRPAIEMPDDPF